MVFFAPTLFLALMKACEKSLVAEDPYQFEQYSVEQLVDAASYRKHTEVLIKEIHKRLDFEELTRDEREVLEKALNRIEQVTQTEEV